MAATGTAEPLSPDDASRLADFGRACKAAARVVALYPATHPAIQASLARIAESAGRLRGNGVAVLTILPDDILLGGRGALKADASLKDLAGLLHAHQIGRMALNGDLTPAGWHALLRLVTRSADDVRAEGGIARAWEAAARGAIELDVIDYREVLRERRGLLESDWDQIIATCLEGDRAELDEDTIATLVELMGDRARFEAFTERLVSRAAAGGAPQRDAVLVLLQALVEFVARKSPDLLDRALDDITRIVPRLTPDLLITLLTTGAPSSGAPPRVDLPREIRGRMTDRTIAEFVARSVARPGTATSRLAEAFHALAPVASDRAYLLELARHEAASLPMAQQEGFAELWRSAADLLSSYSDASFVSEDYGRELESARTQAAAIESVSDDPPERIQSWLSTVSEPEVQRLDSQVLADLLAVESRPDAWAKLLDSAIGFVEEILIDGDAALAQPLLEAVAATALSGSPLAGHAQSGLDRLGRGPFVQHVVLAARRATDEESRALAACCRAVGPDIIAPLVDALAAEQGGVARRLGDVVLGFGASARPHAERLRTSTNPAVRRVAVELLRSVGGPEALTSLAALMDDREPAVQRDAVRAVIEMASAQAHDALIGALDRKAAGARDAVLTVLRTSADPRAIQLFVRILGRPVRSQAQEDVALLAIEALGRLAADDAALTVLERQLVGGRWWAPRRSQRMRRAAATALARSGATAAKRLLEETAARGPLGARFAARAALTAAPARVPPRERR
jgi:hypothetical protein